MNQADLFVLAVVGASAFSGSRRGLIVSAGDIIALVLGLLLGSVAYPAPAAVLRWSLRVPEASAGALGFIVVSVSVVALAVWGFSALSRRFELSGLPSRIGGAAFGSAYGVVLAAVLLLASGLMVGLSEPVSESALGSRITAVVPRLHEGMESLGLPLPKLARFPSQYKEEVEGGGTELRFVRINFSRLHGATCLHCRSPVIFEGYRFSRGTLMSPRFRCPQCGRTSDGCQTFEGFHTIYGECPAALAQEGLQFDCGVWTNGWWTVPHGTCPVCGKEYRPPEARQPGRTAPAIAQRRAG